jgi:hypothetical protein
VLSQYEIKRKVKTAKTPSSSILFIFLPILAGELDYTYFMRIFLKCLERTSLGIGGQDALLSKASP